MTDSLFISAFLLGFLGSFHCVGMCGPLALMLPVSHHSKTGILLGRMLYNAGRITTYIILGLVLGFIGLAATIKGFQKELSIATGVIILVLVGLSGVKKYSPWSYSFTSAISLSLRGTLKKLFSERSFLSLYLIGVINGLLPCGFVYIAIAGALAAGNHIDGAFYMLLFGAGTIPVMFFISASTSLLSIRWRSFINRLTPFAAIAVALILIYRGSHFEKSCCSKKKSAATTQLIKTRNNLQEAGVFDFL